MEYIIQTLFKSYLNSCKTVGYYKYSYLWFIYFLVLEQILDVLHHRYMYIHIKCNVAPYHISLGVCCMINF